MAKAKQSDAITLYEGHPLAGKNKKSDLLEYDGKEQLFDKSSPVYKAFSIDRIKEGWVFVTITFQNGAITDITYSEPDLKAIILEKFKIAAAKYWSTIG